MKLKFVRFTIALSVILFSFSSEAQESKGYRTVIPVNPELFIKEGLAAEITRKEHKLSDGSTTLCYLIKTKATPNEHEMGPWSPRHIDDGKDKGGIWLKDGEVYEVDGKFMANLAEFYNDSKWDLIREDGSIKVTDTLEAFNSAARPNVDPRYQNHAVEGKAEWFHDHTVTFVIPVTPIYQETSKRLGRNGIGIAFNGVAYEPPAPLQAILRAHTIATFDDAGGHHNPHLGYHYHAATGKTKEIEQEDGHAPMIGYAMDGFGIYAQLDEEGNAPNELDECGGHYDNVRGYHYHAGPAGGNQILKAFRGIPGVTKLGHAPKKH